MFVVVVTRSNGNLWLYGQYQNRETAIDIQKKVGGEVMTFDEYKRMQES